MTSQSAATDDIEALAKQHAARVAADEIVLYAGTNLMSPRAAAMLASPLGLMPAMGRGAAREQVGVDQLVAIEHAAEVAACRLFGARWAEVRLQSCTIANLAIFATCCRRGDRIVATPRSAGGHISHHTAGPPGMLGLDVVDLPYDAAKRAPDDASAAELIYRVRPSLVVLGASYMPELYAFEHIRAAATSVGALILYDIAHVAGLIAGGRAPNPLDLGADLITLSTYKSLGGPPGAIIAGRDSELETRVRQVAYPGLTSNYDASRVAALAISLNEMTVHGEAYASAMLTNARALERALLSEGLRIIPSSTHHIGIPVGTEGDARSAVDTLRACGLLSGVTAMSGDVSHGLRLGTQLITRRGFTPDDMVVLAQFIGAALRGGQTDDIRRRVMKFARLRSDLHFCT